MKALGITIPRGYGSIQPLADGSLQVSIPIDDSLDGYRELSRAFIGLGVSLMYEGRELHGDLASKEDTDPAKNSAGSESPGASEDTPTPGRDIAEEA